MDARIRIHLFDLAAAVLDRCRPAAFGTLAAQPDERIVAAAERAGDVAGRLVATTNFDASELEAALLFSAISATVLCEERTPLWEPLSQTVLSFRKRRFSHLLDDLDQCGCHYDRNQESKSSNIAVSKHCDQSMGTELGHQSNAYPQPYQPPLTAEIRRLHF
ncbi:hypothetical protein HGP14_12635 [Rhizobium sp. P32RR-XVIII]|uniref:hypothetical protein n=1 Tax=Rhizobium sp. P32RR-XVIII TaxID=2726738 RepID=UPI0014563EED|nr:hypothetical protein [Rhizobium sp. P32RR-XVIII]NLS04201.1 hypothetical protein [Rhizobium sp. P32RR-XVIII]